MKEGGIEVKISATGAFAARVRLPEDLVGAGASHGSAEVGPVAASLEDPVWDSQRREERDRDDRKRGF